LADSIESHKINSQGEISLILNTMPVELFLDSLFELTYIFSFDIDIIEKVKGIV